MSFWLGLTGVATLAILEAPLFLLITALSLLFFFFVNLDVSAWQTIVIEMNRLASMPILIALPLFTLAGCLLTETKAPNRLTSLMQALTGWMPGGLAMATLLSCSFFTALTGASGVTIVALGSFLYPILIKANYSERFSLGLLTTSGSLGLLFPPSLPIILYGLVAQVDIPLLYRSAIVPGVILIIGLALYAWWYDINQQKKNGSSKIIRQSFDWKRLTDAVWLSKPEWPILLLILWGIYGGYVTVAETSALVVAYLLIVHGMILKEIDFKKRLVAIFTEASLLSGAIIVILAVALGFTAYLVDEQVPDRILQMITSISSNKFVFLMMLNVFLLIVGCLMDIFSAIVIIVPIMVPIAVKFGIHPIHLGIIFLINLEIGYSTPPVGMNLFISSLKFNKPVTELYRASVPYLLLLIAMLIVITYLPFLSLMWV